MRKDMRYMLRSWYRVVWLIIYAVINYSRIKIVIS